MNRRWRGFAGGLRWYEAVLAGLVAACGLTAAIVVAGFAVLIAASPCDPNPHCEKPGVSLMVLVVVLAVVIALWAAVAVARERRGSAIAATLSATVLWCLFGVLLAPQWL